jgi:putative restriction endonuclease
MVDLSNLIVGNLYDRPTLATMWGYKTFNAISRGVVTPKGQDLIILFITKEKQESLTQYEDHIEQDILFWEGEKEHGSDKRIISERDIIHVFYRAKHHSPFIYEGRAGLRSYKFLVIQPSKFTFHLIDRKVEIESIVNEIQENYFMPVTEREAIIKSRLGQGLYRQKALSIWKTCSVTHFTKEEVLIASHIKPWKLSNNEERVNPYNSLILVPTLDKLFDKGYIGFDGSNGKILLSEKINSSDWKRIGISKELQLNQIPFETKAFLDYHNNYVFDLSK